VIQKTTIVINMNQVIILKVIKHILVCAVRDICEELGVHIESLQMQASKYIPHIPSGANKSITAITTAVPTAVQLQGGKRPILEAKPNLSPKASFPPDNPPSGPNAKETKRNQVHKSTRCCSCKIQMEKANIHGISVNVDKRLKLQQ
jgi:hypothetical protein